MRYLSLLANLSLLAVSRPSTAAAPIARLNSIVTPAGLMIEEGGTGHNNGWWYNDRDGQVWGQWFSNSAPDANIAPDRLISPIDIHPMNAGLPSYIEIIYGSSHDEWSDREGNRMALTEAMQNYADWDMVHLLDNDRVLPGKLPGDSWHTLDDMSTLTLNNVPEWIAIQIDGYTLIISGEIRMEHRPIPEPTSIGLLLGYDVLLPRHHLR